MTGEEMGAGLVTDWVPETQVSGFGSTVEK